MKRANQEASMAGTCYAIWNRKAEFLPNGIIASRMYTLYGCEPADIEQWEYLGPSGEPNQFVARDVRTKGFSLQELSAENAERAKRLYK